MYKVLFVKRSTICMIPEYIWITLELLINQGEMKLPVVIIILALSKFPRK